MVFKNTLTTVAAVAIVLCATGIATAEPHTYVVDPAHSSVTFAVRHMVISNVKGAFDKMEGTITYDSNDMTKSSVDVVINAASINTKNEDRDKHLRSDDFLAAEEHPSITFKSKKIKKHDDGWVAVGDLTIRGVAKEVALPFVVNGPVTNPWGQTVMGVEIEFKLNRQDYGVKWSQKLDSGGLVVADDVKIEIQLEAKKS